MTFNSTTFLIFFALVLILHHLPFSWREKKRNLLIASYLFYSAWNPPFVLLLWLSTVVDWVASRAIHRSEGRRRTGWLMLSLATNLGVLAFFKYGEFLLHNFQVLLSFWGITYQAPEFNIVLPMGISFYTFQTLSYTIDIYNRRATPCDSFLDYALFVTFFPQLVAGPIMRSSHFLPQCLQPARANAEQMGWGLTLMTIGLFQKIVLADMILAPVADEVFADPAAYSFTGAWLGTLAFSGQIFCDFSGYSLCGIGAALCLGFVVPDNFRFPYAAIGFSDFWRRWHISLSSWLRDYLYIPLGGNRGSRLYRSRNLMLTMLIGGLWHGAGWHFVAWGGLHGLYLIGEAELKRLFSHQAVWYRPSVQFGLGIATYLLVCITWVFFRAPDFDTALILLSTMLSGGPVEGILPGGVRKMLVVIGGLLTAHWILRETTLEQAMTRMPRWGFSGAVSVMLMIMTITHGEDRGFIYFQF